MSMKAFITNSGGTEFQARLKKWEISEYLDSQKYGEASLTFSSRVPIRELAKVRLEENGVVVFRGYVPDDEGWDFDYTENTIDLTLKSEKHILYKRFTPNYTFVGGAHRLGNVFDSAAPAQTTTDDGPAYRCGLLWSAQSKIPCNPELAYSGESIYMLDGWGTQSAIGNLDNIYVDGIKYTRRATYALMAANTNSVYSDANDLYVNSLPYGTNSTVYADMAFDAGIRYGGGDKDSTIMSSYAMLGCGHGDRTIDLFVNFAKFHGMQVGETKTKDYTYLVTREELGDGADTGLFTLGPKAIKRYKITPPADPRPGALIGLGEGSRPVRQVYIRANPRERGLFTERTVDVSGGFVDANGLLIPYVDDEYESSAKVVHEIYTRRGPRARVGDWIWIHPLKKPRQLLQVKSVTWDHKRNIHYELNGRGAKYSDLETAASALSDKYRLDYLKELDGWTETCTAATETTYVSDIGHPSCTPWVGKCTVTNPGSGQNERVLLSVSFSDIVELPVRCSIKIFSNAPKELIFPHCITSEPLTSIDITQWAVYGSEMTIYVYLYYNGNFPSHSSCSQHPSAKVSASVSVARRKLIV